MIFLFSSVVFASPRAEFVRAVLDAHPAVAAAEARARAAGREAAGVPLLDPVMVSVGVAPLSLATRPGVDLEARWALPRFGMVRAARDVAAAKFAEAQADGAMGRNEVAAMASMLVDTLWELDGTERILDQRRDTLAASAAALDRRLAAGLGMPDQVALARMEGVELEVEAAMLSRRRAEAEAEVRALGAAPARFDGDPGPVLADAAAAPPVVGAARASAAMARADAEMARREGRPMTEAMAGWSSMWEDEMHRAMVGFGVSVPLDFAARRARVDGASARSEAAEAAISAVERAATEELARAEAMRDEARAVGALLRERLHPLARQRAAAVRTAWEAGGASLADWLEAERDAGDVEIRIVTATADLHRAEAMVALARGQVAGLPEEHP